MAYCSKHPAHSDPDCFRCKLVSVQFGNVEPPPQRLTEARWSKDLPAYKRLRDQGLQPKATKGCYELETRAHSQFEIDHHGLVEPTLWAKAKNQIEETVLAVKEGERDAKEQGVGVEQVRDWWKDDTRKKKAS